VTDRGYFCDDYLPNQGELGDGAVGKLGELSEIYNFVNWSKSQISLDEKLHGSQNP
jgi:hypothetical protein